MSAGNNVSIKTFNKISLLVSLLVSFTDSPLNTSFRHPPSTLRLYSVPMFILQVPFMLGLVGTCDTLVFGGLRDIFLQCQLCQIPRIKA